MLYVNMKSSNTIKWVTVIGLLLLLVYFVPLIFISKEQEVKSPNGSWVAIQYQSADEAHLVPYGQWVEIKPFYKFWHKPDSYDSVFAGSCENESLKLEWLNENTLNISCFHGQCPIARQHKTKGDISIQYFITSSGLECAT